MDQANNKITIIAKDIDDTKNEVGQLVVSSKDITAQLDKINQNFYMFEAGKGNIFDNCEYSLVKTSEDLERETYSIPSLGIAKNYLKGKDIVLSLSVYVLNGYASLGNKIGVEFDIVYKGNVKKTYAIYWYLGQYDLQYLLQTSTNNVDKRIWVHYKLEDEDIENVSNLRMIIDVNADRAIASNPKVEFGTTPTGFEYDLSKIRDNVNVLISQYAGIETTIEKLTARVEKDEQDTINITTNVNDLKDEMNTIGMNVDSINERVFTNEDSIQAQIIETQNNYSSIVSTIESLKIRTAHTEENIATINQNVTSVSNELTSAKNDISKNSENIGTLNDNVSSINGDIGNIEKNIDSIESDVSSNKDSLDKITVTVNQTVEKYTEIETTVNTLSLKAVDQEEKTTTIEKNVNGAIEKIETVESRVNNTEIALQPKNIILAVNELLSKDDAISTTSFTLDKNGAHIKNGALDITNSMDEKVFYTDTDGNLTVVGNITGSTISGSTFIYRNSDSSSIKINDYGLRLYGPEGNGFIGMKTSQGFLLGVESPIVYAKSESSEDVWNALFSQGFNMMRLMYNTNRYIELQCLDKAYGITIWASDETLKKNIIDTSISALEKINAIRHVDFDWVDNDCHVECGYIAQEIMQIDEEYVIPIIQQDGSKLYQINSTTIIPLLSKAIQELSSKVETLERRLEENGISY